MQNYNEIEDRVIEAMDEGCETKYEIFDYLDDWMLRYDKDDVLEFIRDQREDRGLEQID